MPRRAARLSWAVALFVVALTALAGAQPDPAAVDRPSGSAASVSAKADFPPGGVVPKDEATKRVTSEVGVYNDDHHVTVFTPSVAASIDNVDGASLRGSYLADIVSAASPDIVSTASPRFQELRHAGSLYGQYKPRDFGVGVGGAVSSEPDYLAAGGFLSLVHDFDDKNWSLQFGAGLMHDTIGRCNGQDQPCTPFSVFSRDLWRSSFNAGVNLVLDKASTLGVVADLVLENGDQSKPYRYVPTFAPQVAAQLSPGDAPDGKIYTDKPLEQLPLARHRYALTARYSRRFGASTLRAMERVYKDSWGLLATTTDVRWIFDLGKRFSVWPHVRFHYQRGASFWKLAYVSDPGAFNLPLYRTGDRELSPLFTAGGGGGIRFYFGSDAHPENWAVQLSGDVMYTSFQNTLIVTSRVAVLGALGFEGTF